MVGKVQSISSNRSDEDEDEDDDNSGSFSAASIQFPLLLKLDKKNHNSIHKSRISFHDLI